MARNIRTMAVKAFTVEYGIAKDGKLATATATLETESPRKITRALATQHNVDPAQVVIINVTESATEYRITDVVKALQLLADNGLAEVITDDAPATDNKAKKSSAKK